MCTCKPSEGQSDGTFLLAWQILWIYQTSSTWFSLVTTGFLQGKGKHACLYFLCMHITVRGCAQVGIRVNRFSLYHWDKRVLVVRVATWGQKLTLKLLLCLSKCSLRKTPHFWLAVHSQCSGDYLLLSSLHETEWADALLMIVQMGKWVSLICRVGQSDEYLSYTWCEQ